METYEVRIDQRDGFIDLKQFKKWQIIEHTEVQHSWMIVDVRENWLKLLPLFDCYEGDPRKHFRRERFSVDLAFKDGWWRIRRNG